MAKETSACQIEQAQCLPPASAGGQVLIDLSPALAGLENAGYAG
jgi:hypothetical protein